MVISNKMHLIIVLNTDNSSQFIQYKDVHCKLKKQTKTVVNFCKQQYKSYQLKH